MITILDARREVLHGISATDGLIALQLILRSQTSRADEDLEFGQWNREEEDVVQSDTVHV